MSYTKQKFVNNQTVLTAAMMNHIEDGIVENEAKIGQLSEEIGAIDTALDAILTMQNSYIGGEGA